MSAPRPRIFRDALLAFPDFFARGELLVEQGTIRAIWIEERAASLSAGTEEIDCGGLILAPGLVDIHNNGGMGAEFVAGDPDGNNRALEYHAAQGVTSVLATVMTERPEQMIRGLETLIEQTDARTICQNFAGIHIEGPYFHPDKRGAHRLECLRKPDPAEYARWQAICGEWLKIVTFAPEIEGALDFCDFLNARGIVPSIGHTTATFEQIRRAAARGASHFVHANNAIDWPTRRPLREGWLGTELMGMGALLVDSRFTAEIIADGFHVPPEMIRVLINARGSSALCLVSDAAPPCGMPPGKHQLAGMEIESRTDRLVLALGGSVQGVPPMGGSATSLLKMVQQSWRWGGSLLEALKMATYSAARAARLPRKGQLLVGNDADLILLDQQAALHAVYLRGERYPLTVPK